MSNTWQCSRCKRVWLEDEQRCPVCWGWDHLDQKLDEVAILILQIRADIIALEQQTKSRG